MGEMTHLKCVGCAHVGNKGQLFWQMDTQILMLRKQQELRGLRRAPGNTSKEQEAV